MDEAAATNWTLDQVVGHNVQVLRQAAGKSQTELAEAMQAMGWAFHQQTVLKIEKGSRPLKLAEALSIAAVLEVPVDRLWAEPETVMRDRLLLEAVQEIERRYRLVTASAFVLASSHRELERLLEEPEPYSPETAEHVERARPLTPDRAIAEFQREEEARTNGQHREAP